MSSSSNSQGMFFATAMAVSGTAILLAFGLQKSTTQFLVNQILQSSEAHPRSCISLERKKKNKKKKKKVHFAEDVVDPIGNSEEYRRKRCNNKEASILRNSSSTTFKKVANQEMPANRMALYNGILRDRVHNRVAYSH